MICNGKWGNDMEEQTGKLLKECSSGCKMAINSLNQVRDFVKDEKLHQLLDEYDKKHKALEEDISRLLEKHGEQENGSSSCRSCIFQDYNGCEADAPR